MNQFINKDVKDNKTNLLAESFYIQNKEFGNHFGKVFRIQLKF